MALTEQVLHVFKITVTQQLKIAGLEQVPGVEFAWYTRGLRPDLLGVTSAGTLVLHDSTDTTLELKEQPRKD